LVALNHEQRAGYNHELVRLESFPDPAAHGILVAPFGPDCYELRHGAQLLLFGKGDHVAERMTSLLPWPAGTGTRKNQPKRKYVLEHLAEIEYRTRACADIAEAKALERELKANRDAYLFHERRGPTRRRNHHQTSGQDRLGMANTR
jgi:hypothetical protein